MPSRNSSATDEALRLVDQGWTAYKAAKTVGINLSTIYRALKRRRLEDEEIEAEIIRTEIRRGDY